MTGPQHYEEAERLLDPDNIIRSERDTALRLAAAQVHATLALAAATALNGGSEGLTKADWDAWRDTASAYEPGGQP